MMKEHDQGEQFQVSGLLQGQHRRGRRRCASTAVSLMKYGLRKTPCRLGTIPVYSRGELSVRISPDGGSFHTYVCFVAWRRHLDADHYSAKQTEMFCGSRPTKDFVLDLSFIIYTMQQIYSTLDNKLNARQGQRIN